jgi:hypothetical protein
MRAMDARLGSGLFLGLVALGAIALLSTTWAGWQQRRTLAELRRQLHESEESRRVLESRVQQVDGQLAALSLALAHARMPAMPDGRAATGALLAHLGDSHPHTDSGWVDTEPSPSPDEPPYPAFAETQPAELAREPQR